MRRGFTLIELLLVVAILSTMVTVGIMGVNSSRASIGTFAAARDVMAAVRRARSVALVTQKPVAVVYSNTTSGDEVAASVEILSEKLFTSKGGQAEVRDLDGEIVRESGEAATGDEEGETLAEILSPKNVPPDVLKGLRISVTKEDEDVVYRPDEAKRSKISIYSTADSVVRSYAEPEKSAATQAEKGAGTDASEPAEAAPAADEPPFKAVFAANGTVDPPHLIRIYPDGSDPGKGLLVSVDRFGEPRCGEVDKR